MTAQEFYSAHQTTLVNVPRVALAILAILICAGCSEVSDMAGLLKTAPAMAKNGVVGVACPSELETIALDQLMGKFPQYDSLDVWLSGDESEGRWKPLLDAEQTELNRLSKWTDSLPRCERTAYKGWLNYWQGELNGAWGEVRFHGQRDEMDAFDRDNKNNDDHKHVYESAHAVPKPPL